MELVEMVVFMEGLVVVLEEPLPLELIMVVREQTDLLDLLGLHN
jgi:hypothetical protein